MRLLLDTHVAVWAAMGHPSFVPFRDALEDEANDVFVSPVVAWEVATKVVAGKLVLSTSVSGFVAQIVAAFAATELQIRSAHAAEIEHLPRLHGDPFDRMLVAQARVENLVLATADAQVRRYAVAVYP